MNAKLIGLSLICFVFYGNSFAEDWGNRYRDRDRDARSNYRINKKLNEIIRKLDKLENRLQRLEMSVRRLRTSGGGRNSVYDRENKWKCVIEVRGHVYIGRASDRNRARRLSLRNCRAKGWNSCPNYRYKCIPPY